MAKKDKSNLPPPGQLPSGNNERADTLAAVFHGGGFEKPRKDGWGRAGGYLIAGIVGACTAIVVVLAVVSGTLKGIPILDHIDLAALLSPSAPITIARTERITVTAEERTVDVSSRITPFLYGIYAKKDLTADAAGLIHSGSAPRAHAIALTSDGWLISAGALSVAEAGELAVVAGDGKSYPVLQRLQDEATGVWFLHLDASTLVAASLRRDSLVSAVGTPVLLATFHIGSTPLIYNQSFAGTVVLPFRDADRLEARVRLSQPVIGAPLGAPIVMLSGEVAAIVSAVEGGNAVAVPVANLTAVFNQAFKDGIIERPAVGVRYIELSSVADVAFSLTRGRRQGALLLSQGKIPAVAPKSNAAQAGLKEGDIITKVEGELVREESDLATLLQSYPATARVKLTVVREGEERLIDLSLAVSATATPQKQ